MTAYFLTKPDGTTSDISQCGVCGSVARGTTNFDISERCCSCWHCGVLLADQERKHNTHYHYDCDRKRYEEREAARLDKAVLVEDYDGPVYLEGVGSGSFGDCYFADVDELSEHIGELESSGYEFAFCCTSAPCARLDLDSILENATEEAHEDAGDSLNGVEDLQAAVDVFNAANANVLSWSQDFSRKVRIPKATA